MTTSSGTSHRAETRALAERMAAAASDLLAALAPDQHATATYDIADGEERRRWYYTPTDHGGLPLGDMTPSQQQLTHKLVASGLSVPAYVTASTIMGLENTLDAAEGWRLSFARDRGGRGRDPLMYYVSIFGAPGGAAPWGWRFGGHHISLSYTVVDGRIVAPTPTFFGAHPAEARFVGPSVLRPLAGEEDLARELLHTLNPEQRAAAVVAGVAPVDMVTGNRPAVEHGQLPPAQWEIFREQLEGPALERSQSNQARMEQALGLQQEHLEALRYTDAPKGLAAARLTAAQRQILDALLHQYIGRMPEELATIETARLTDDLIAQIHFAWAGSDEPRRPHYYRLQGPRLLVEYDNTQNDTNHIHSVWRDPEGDFGADLLAQHYARAH